MMKINKTVKTQTKPTSSEGRAGLSIIQHAHRTFDYLKKYMMCCMNRTEFRLTMGNDAFQEKKGLCFLRYEL